MTILKTWHPNDNVDRHSTKLKREEEESLTLKIVLTLQLKELKITQVSVIEPAEEQKRNHLTQRRCAKAGRRKKQY